MLNKAPSYQWYPDKWLADTRRLSWKAKGLYKDLLDTIWLQFQDTCSIPDDPVFVAGELGCTVQEWEEARSEIMCEHRPLMQIITNRLFSNGLMKEREKQLLRRNRLAENGRKGGRPKSKRFAEKQTPANQMKRLPSPTPTPTPSPSLSKTKNCPPEVDGRSDFDIFWSLYPRKEGKGAARKAFERKKCPAIMAKIELAIERQKKSEQWQKDGGQYIPMPATWINQERWDDEGTVAPKRKSLFDPPDKKGGP